VNVPKRGVGETSMQKVAIVARGMNTFLTNAADMMMRGEEIKGPAKTGLRRFILDMERWRAQVAHPRSSAPAGSDPRGVGLHRHAAGRQIPSRARRASTT